MLQWPVSPEYRISSSYGRREDPTEPGRFEFHGGVDIACPVGTPVVAPFDCHMKRAWDDEVHGGGMSVVFEAMVPSPDGRRTRCVSFGFCHLSAYAPLVTVHSRDLIPRGTIVAYSGGARGHKGSGRSTGAHLHMTCRVDGEKVDPMSLGWTVQPPSQTSVPFDDGWKYERIF